MLMDKANQVGGMVIGTGDMSELALGWATYNGDHMSMYGVNASVPKTLVRHLVKYYADSLQDEELRKVLLDVLDTPVSPELIPPSKNGNICLLYTSTKWAAYATVFAQGSSFVFSAIHLRKKHDVFDIKIRSSAIKKDKIWAILDVGIPSAVQMAVVNVSFLIITGMLNIYGVEVALSLIHIFRSRDMVNDRFK